MPIHKSITNQSIELDKKTLNAEVEQKLYNNRWGFKLSKTYKVDHKNN